MSNALKSACWTLVFGTFLLLGILGKFDLLVILLPLSLLLAFVVAGSCRATKSPDVRSQKGVA